MATIQILDIHQTGSSLFIDSESYLNELTDDELSLLRGGISPTFYFASVAITIATAAGAAYGWGPGPRC